MTGKIDEIVYIPVIVHEGLKMNFGSGDGADGHFLGFKTMKQAQEKIEKARKSRQFIGVDFEILSYKKVN